MIATQPRTKLVCTCHGTETMAEYVDNGLGRAVVVRTKRHGETHTLVIAIDKDGKVCLESTN